MDKQYPELNLVTKLFIENREYEIRWNKSSKLDDMFQIAQFIQNDILKIYSTDQAIVKDHEMQEYGLKDIISFQVREVYVFLPHKKEVRTYIKNDLREFRQVYFFISTEQVKIERFREKYTRIDSMITNMSIIRKQNQQFENTLRQIVESRLNNLQINNPQSANLFFVSEPSQQENLNEKDDQLSPKFGSTDTSSSSKNNSTQAQKVPSFGEINNNNNFLGGQKDQLFDTDDQDLKKRSKVAGLGTQQDYLKKQAQQKPAEIKGYTMQEVAHHNTENDAWIVINGKIYDVTHYLNYHPGGKAKLMLGVGRDGTELFQKYHPWVNAHYILQKNHIGFIVLK
ncbi:hypothetical protein ABPG72_007790 [Tetrahymena utriculariae]